MLLMLFALLAQDPTAAPATRAPLAVRLDEMTRPAPVSVDAETPVPGWALTDPARWERSQRRGGG